MRENWIEKRFFCFDPTCASFYKEGQWSCSLRWSVRMESTKPGKITEQVRLVWALVRLNKHENSNSNFQYSQICFALNVPSRLENYSLRYRGFLAMNWWKNVGLRPPFNTCVRKQLLLCLPWTSNFSISEVRDSDIVLCLSQDDK